ncbi:PREDICTED: armadillo repeat-containing protein 8 [Ipomoea nil]|uniref:armadillo repeat-containing protein 8 n=1 Tax=Ipomoea nil TaxID=35883 RepID=UPI000901F001|nr:PREDICTED: armadillo repeat-containing protein 8 [Ipomoea nil]
MPTSASPTPHHYSRTEDLIGRLSSTSPEIQLKALREVKNQIIGNRTKKLSFLKLGAVPAVVSVLSSVASAQVGGEIHDSLVIQSAAAIGSFSCGFDAGVKAVLEAGAFPLLLRLIYHSNDKVVDAGARSLKLIYQSRLAPKYDFIQVENVEFILFLLSSENENVSGLGASIISHSCKTCGEQKALSDAGVTKKLISLLRGSLVQRDASLEALATIVKGNPEVILKFMEPESGRALSTVIELTKDKNSRTKLLACTCLISIRNTSHSYLQDVQIKRKLILILLELLEDSGQVGDEAPFVLSSLLSENEELQRLAFEANAINRLCKHLEKGSLQPRRSQGILHALADLCSRLECCKDRLLSLEALKLVTDALSSKSPEVRVAACICLKNVSRSVKNLSAGCFMKETVIVPLVELLFDDSDIVQVAALGAISNVVVDFAANKSMFMQCGGVKQLVQLSRSMDSTIRVKAVCALRNLIFLVNNRCKEEILLELTQPMLRCLICDSEASVQEQALALVRNLVDGPIDCIDYVFVEDALLLHAVGRQLQSALKTEVLIQGMYVLGNVASGNEFHKEAVMHQLFPPSSNDTHSVVFKFLQSHDSQLRTAAVWALVNLTFPSGPGAFHRAVKLRNSGVLSQLKNMVNDPCLDVKLRARTALGQSVTSGDGSA